MTTVAPDAPVDLPRLVVLVRARRVLRLGTRLTLAALPVWFIVVLVAIGSTDDYSSTHAWFVDHANRGVVIILAILVVEVLLTVGIRSAGDAGALASRLVPVAGSVPDPVVSSASTPGNRLLDVGSRDRRVRPPGVARWPTVLLGVGLATFIVVSGSTAAMIGPQYRASHGLGGPVVTLGENSRITRVDDSGFDDDTSYYISSPLGEALVDGAARRPETGTKFVIVAAYNGRQAVELGGSNWITSLVTCILSFLLGCVVLFFLMRRVRAGVPDERLVPLATTIASLARRKSVAVQLIPRRGDPPARPGTALTAAIRTDRGADAVVDRVRRQTRRVTAGIVAVLFLTGLLAAFV